LKTAQKKVKVKTSLEKEKFLTSTLGLGKVKQSYTSDKPGNRLRSARSE
jgi:hypothetical protein